MMNNLIKLNQRRWALQLALIIGLTLLFLAALLGGLQDVTPARADPDTRYVNGATGSDDSDCGNPADPCATIGYALTQAGNGDEIRVAGGTYTGTSDIAITVTLKGGYTMSGTLWLLRTSETIVDAQGANSPVFTIGPGHRVTLEGITIRGANHTSGEGGGFYINAANVIISDTVIRDNSTVGPGSGVWIENSVGAENVKVSLINSTVISNSSVNGSAGLMVGDGDPIQLSIENTVFTKNTGNDVLALDNQPFEIVGGQVNGNTITTGAGDNAINVGGSGSGIISGTEIISNTSRAMDISSGSVVSAYNLTILGNTGGGIVNGGVLTLTNSLIENNSGSTWAVIGSENEGSPESNRLVVDGCTIRGNETPGIVAITTGYGEIRNTKIISNAAMNCGGCAIVNSGETVEATDVRLVNVLLADNETQVQPIVFQSAGSTTLMNVTVAGNNTNGDQQILFAHGTMTVTNTILWGNINGDEDLLGGPGILSVSYSDIEGGWTGTGNIDAGPKFVDAASGDYRLGVGSPCVDRGTPIGAPAADIEGTPRDAAPDMGTYEWVGFRIFLPLMLRNVGS